MLVLLNTYGDQPNPKALVQAKNFLIEIEKWKADCLQQRMGNAAKNSNHTIWQAFQGVVNAATDTEAILSIMQLKGFGSSADDETGQRRAKVATSVLRLVYISSITLEMRRRSSQPLQKTTEAIPCRLDLIASCSFH